MRANGRLRIPVRARAATAATVILFSFSAHAEVLRGDSTPQALTGVPAAANSCRIADGGLDPTPGVTPAPAASRSLCTTVTSDAALQSAQRGALLIDVRPLADYQTFHIEGAINADVAAVQSKPYWRNVPVVLIGNGKAEGELLAQCDRVWQSGYHQLRVLHGGMPAWLGSGHPVQGNAPPIGSQTRLTAAEYLLESRDRENVLLLDKTQSPSRLEGRRAIESSEGPLATVKSLLTRRPLSVNRTGAVVLATSESFGDEQIAALQRAVLPVPLLIYIDGREALVRQSMIERAVWAAYSRGPRQPGCGL